MDKNKKKELLKNKTKLVKLLEICGGQKER